MESAPRMTWSVERADGRVRLTLAGALDLGTAGTARGLLRSAQQRTCDLTLDLSALSSIDAAGLGVLVASLRQADAIGRSLAICGVTEAIVEAFRLMGLERLLRTETAA